MRTFFCRTKQKSHVLFTFQPNFFNRKQPLSHGPGTHCSNVLKSFCTRKAIAKSQTLWSQSCLIHIFLIWTKVPFMQEVSGEYTNPFLDTDELNKALLFYRTEKFLGLSRNRPLTITYNSIIKSYYVGLNYCKPGQGLSGHGHCLEWPLTSASFNWSQVLASKITNSDWYNYECSCEKLKQFKQKAVFSLQLQNF